MARPTLLRALAIGWALVLVAWAVARAQGWLDAPAAAPVEAAAAEAPVPVPPGAAEPAPENPASAIPAPPADPPFDPMLPATKSGGLYGEPTPLLPATKSGLPPKPPPRE